MKKYLSLILVMALLSSMLCMGVSAAPALPSDTQVNVTLGLTSDVIHRYSADVEYDSMIFVYHTSNIQWTVDEKGYSYEHVSGNGDWEDASEDLKIVNHSDLKLGYTVTMEKDPKYNALVFTLNDAEQATGTLAACTTVTPFGTIKDSVKVVVSGDIPPDAVEGDTLGTLTITFKSAT